VKLQPKAPVVVMKLVVEFLGSDGSSVCWWCVQGGAVSVSICLVLTLTLDIP